MSDAESTAQRAAKSLAELKVSGHLMTLDAGLYCIIQHPSRAADAATGLPGVRLSLPPSAAGRPDAVSIRTFRDDGWLQGAGDAALVRVEGGPAQLLVTIYQSPGAEAAGAPSLQVARLLDAAFRPGAAPAAVPAAPRAVDVLAHVQGQGDVGGQLGAWVGERGSKRWVEGFAIAPSGGIPADDIEYQAVLGRGWMSPWVEGGQFCGSRGMALPILGLRVRLRGATAETHELQLRRQLRRRHRGRPGGGRRSLRGGEPCPGGGVHHRHPPARPGRGGPRRPRSRSGAGPPPRRQTRRRQTGAQTRRQTGAQASRQTGQAARRRQAGGRPTVPALPAAAAPAAPPLTAPPALTGGQGSRSRFAPRPCVRYLFVHQNFPGQYLHFVRHLLEDRANDVVFLSEPNPNMVGGVRRVFYEKPVAAAATHPNARDLDAAVRRAEATAVVARNLRGLGFTPDIIIGHHGWGELLNLLDVWPAAPLLGYFEFYYATDGQDVGFDPEFPTGTDQFPHIRAMNSINLLALSLNQHGQTPTEWQRTRYPAWARPQIEVLPEGARLDICRPDPQLRARPFAIGRFVVRPDEKLVTYVSRNLEPYRGFHVMMRTLPALLAARPDVKVVMVGGDDVSYGGRLAHSTWREHFQRELAGRYDAARVLLPGQLAYPDYLRLLQRSDAHVYLTYPFVASWSLREALACGCAVVAADVEPVREFVADRRNGLLTPALDPKTLCRRLLEVLEDDRLNRRLRAGARRFAETHLDMQRHLAAFAARVAALVGAPGS